MDVVTEFKNHIRDINTISFDVFDTLVLRPFLNPTDMFSYLEESYKVPGFAMQRIAAEKKLRLGLPEVTIDEIYCQIPEYSNMKAIELREEKRLSTARADVKDLFNFAVAHAKQVIIISDIYYSQDYITELLNEKGFSGFSNVFVSSEYKATKQSSELFRVAANALGIMPELIIHVGDNPISDIDSARRLGIQAYYVPNETAKYLAQKPYRGKSTVSWNQSAIARMCAHRYCAQTNTDYWTEFGYEIAGPFCYAFTNWIVKQIDIESNKVDVCFTARDGYLLKRVYELLTGNSSRYIFAPRLIAQLMDSDDKRLDKEEMLQKFKFFFSKPQNANMTLSEIKEKYLEYYDKYIGNLNLKKDVFLIDSRTANFSSQRLIERTLGNKVQALYFINSAENYSLQYRSFFPSMNNPILSWNLIEYFLSAPTPSVLAVSSGGDPEYAEANYMELTREKQFTSIEQGVLNYIQDIQMNPLGLFEISADDIVQWVNAFLLNPSKEDKRFFSTVFFSNDPDHSSNSLLNPFLSKPKSFSDLKEYLLRKLTLHPQLYGIIRKIYRCIKR